MVVVVPVWLLVIMIAAAIPSWASGELSGNFLEVFASAWICHLAVAGMALGGLLTVAVHASCLSCLLRGTVEVGRALGCVFHAQLLTSTLVQLGLGLGDWDGRHGLLFSWGVAYFLRRWLILGLRPLRDWLETPGVRVPSPVRSSMSRSVQ